MTQNSGTFSSPGFPLQFPRIAYCMWTITVQQGGHVKLTFKDFFVGRKNNYDCDWAYVRVYDGEKPDADAAITT